MQACQKDAETICKDTCTLVDEAKECDGKVIECLQWHATEGIHHENVIRVSAKCTKELDVFSEQQAMDYRYGLKHIYRLSK